MPKELPPRLLQAYLKELSHAAAETDIAVRKRELLRSYAELHFRISGGGRCSLCNAHVRHALPVTKQSPDGAVQNFECLCTRCFEGERVSAVRVSIHVGEVTMNYDSAGRITFENHSEEESGRANTAGSGQ